MKQRPIFLILFLIFAFTQVFAQETSVSNAKWNRLESEDKTFSVAFPPSALIDAESRKYNQKLRVSAFQNGVRMDLTMTKETDLKSRPLGIDPEDLPRVTSTKIGDYTVIQLKDSDASRKFETTFRIIKKDTLYFLKVYAKTGQEAELSRFLFSIRIEGKQLFARKDNVQLPEDIVSFSALKTTPEVKEAFDRKIERNKIKITYEASSNILDEIDYEGLTRKVVIVERPPPNYSPSSFTIPDLKLSVQLKVNFLANGQIGDITVLSVGNKEFSNACIESARKIRFVPAQINGQNADTVEIIEYTVRSYTVPGMMPRPR